MNFNELVNKLNNVNLNEKSEIAKIINAINIDANNFKQWLDNVFSEKINMFDMEKLPYLIDELYQTDDKLKFMLCCMLIESSCHKLSFITNLENYPIFSAKFESMLHTLVTVYDSVDNGIANCMSLIIINNDPEFKYFNNDLKNLLVNATKRKLNDILNYLKLGNINPLVYNDLEVIIDMSCYLQNSEISKIINEIDRIGDNKGADIFIMKYNIINNINISKNKLSLIKNDPERIILLYSIMEKLGVNNIYLNDITQEQLAKSDMIRWLTYPTELGSAPDKIELLGDFIFNNTRCFAYKFFKEGFLNNEYLLGVAGGYSLNKVTSISCGYTFSKFEPLLNDWKKQSIELVEFMDNYWKNRN